MCIRDSCKVYSLVDVDCANLPGVIRPYTNMEVNNTSMPVDLLSVVDNIPGVQSVVYNQIIFMPNQKKELSVLDKKKNRHASMPNPSNLIAVEDIKRVQDVIARENKQLVYTHYNICLLYTSSYQLLHSITHACIAYLLVADWSCWLIPVIIFISHFIIDLLKCWCCKDSLSTFLVDQDVYKRQECYLYIVPSR